MTVETHSFTFDDAENLGDLRLGSPFANGADDPGGIHIVFIGGPREEIHDIDGIPPPEQNLAQLVVAGLVPPARELACIQSLGVAYHNASVRSLREPADAAESCQALGEVDWP
jgi:hypothetical protein